MSFGKPQQFLLLLALTVMAALLGRFALDFIAEMSLLLSIPFVCLVAATISVASANIFRRPLQETGSAKERAFFLAAIPAAFFASSLDCMGLSVAGCSAFCTFVKLAWIPLMAILCIAGFFSPWFLTAVLAMSFLPLVPHCVCYNAGNGWWIERIGSSPVCYVWGFAVSLTAVSAMRRGGGQWVSMILCAAIISGAFVFFIGHHYFHFPW
jgi:hypothetical protein